jgi:hypothetical protein
VIATRTPPFRHRATVMRNTETGLDPGRNPLPPVFDIHDADLACDFWVPVERRVEGPDVNVSIESGRMLVRKSADITVGDLVTEVRERGGEVIEQGNLRIQADLPMPPSHRELVLELIAGSFTPEES